MNDEYGLFVVFKGVGGGADDACVVEEFCRYYSGVEVQLVFELFIKFALSAAQDKHIRGKQQFQVLQILVETVGPFLAADFQARARA